MKQKSVKFSIKKLTKMLNENTLTWDTSVQRRAGIWSPNQKGELIHSLLSDYYIPSLCFLKTVVYDEKKKKDISCYKVLDGKQRLSAVFSYINDEYKLCESTPNVILEDGMEYELAGKTFSSLDKILSDKIWNYTFEVISLEDCTEKEIQQLFLRLNSGTALSEAQKIKAAMGSDVAGFINSMLKHDFFDMCNLTTAQRNREDDFTALLQGMMLIDDSYEWADLGEQEVAKYATYLKEHCSIPTQIKISDTLGFLTHVFQWKEKFLTKINIPILIRCGYEATKYEYMDEDVFLCWYEVFTKENEKFWEDYHRYCGADSDSKEKVNGRVKVALDSMEEILKLSENELCDTDYDDLEMFYQAFGKKFIHLN